MNAREVILEHFEETVTGITYSDRIYAAVRRAMAKADGVTPRWCSERHDRAVAASKDALDSLFAAGVIERGRRAGSAGYRWSCPAITEAHYRASARSQTIAKLAREALAERGIEAGITHDNGIASLVIPGEWAMRALGLGDDEG